MERIERLERANFRWRLATLIAFAGILVAGGFAFSQRLQPKGAGEQPLPAVNFPVDAAPAPVTYANFVKVSVTPEELALDLGLNLDVNPDPKQPIRISNRVVMNYFTAKRLSNALQGVVQQYENTYGPIELDFQKRIVPGANAPGGK